MAVWKIYSNNVKNIWISASVNERYISWLCNKKCLERKWSYTKINMDRVGQLICYKYSGLVWKRIPNVYAGKGEFLKNIWFLLCHIRDGIDLRWIWSLVYTTSWIGMAFHVLSSWSIAYCGGLGMSDNCAKVES